MSVVGRRIPVERAPRVPRLGGEEQLVQDGLTFLDVPPEVVVTVRGQQVRGCILAHRKQVYARWLDEHGIPHLGWLPESAIAADLQVAAVPERLDERRTG